MSYRTVGGPSTAFSDWMSMMDDFRKGVEDGDYAQGPQVFDAPVQIGELLIDTPKDPDTGQILLTVTNVATGSKVTICTVP